MQHVNLLLGGWVGLYQTYFFELFLCELLWYWSSLQVIATLPGGSRKFTCCIFLFVYLFLFVLFCFLFLLLQTNIQRYKMIYTNDLSTLVVNDGFVRKILNKKTSHVLLFIYIIVNE